MTGVIINGAGTETVGAGAGSIRASRQLVSKLVN